MLGTGASDLLKALTAIFLFVIGVAITSVMWDAMDKRHLSIKLVMMLIVMSFFIGGAAGLIWLIDKNTKKIKTEKMCPSKTCGI